MPHPFTSTRALRDADRTIAVFAAQLQDAVDVEAARADLLAAVHRTLEPAHASVWDQMAVTTVSMTGRERVFGVPDETCGQVV